MQQAVHQHRRHANHQHRAIAPLTVHGVTLAVPPAIELADVRFSFNDYVSIETAGGVGVTGLGDAYIAIFKDRAGNRTGYQFDVIQGWEQFDVPTPSELPKLSLYERISLVLANTSACWVPYNRLPIFADLVKFDATRGSVSFTDYLGQSKTVVMEDHVKATFELSFGGKITGTYLLVICTPTRANIYRTDEELGYVERVRLDAGRTFRHALLERLPHDSAAHGTVMYREDGTLVLLNGGAPLKLNVFKQWTVHLSKNRKLESLGDGHLLETADRVFTEYYYSNERRRFFRMDTGWRDRVAPWILDCKNPGASTTVCNSAITLFGSGSLEVFGQLVREGEPFDIYGPGDVHAFRSAGSEWIYVCEGVHFQCGVFQRNVFRDKDGVSSDGWGWGSETELPSGRGFDRRWFFVAAAAVWILWMSPQVFLLLGFWLGVLVGCMMLLKRCAPTLMDWYEVGCDFLMDCFQKITSKVKW